MSRQEILRAYRDLYKQSLRTIRYSTPARYSARDILRASFRDNPNPSTSFNSKRIANTLNFLERAAHYNGYEHKIIKNLLLIRWWRTRNAMGLHRNIASQQTPVAAEVRKEIWTHYDATLAMMNESQQLCLSM